MQRSFKAERFYKAVQVPAKMHLYFEGHNSYDNQNKLTDDQKKLAAEMFRAGRRPWYIATHLSLPPHQIYNYLRRRTDNY